MRIGAIGKGKGEKGMQGDFIRRSSKPCVCLNLDMVASVCVCGNKCSQTLCISVVVHRWAVDH